MFHIADELRGRNIQRRRQAEHRSQRRVHLAALQQADVGPVIPALKPKQLLRHLAMLPGAQQRFGERFLRVETGSSAPAIQLHAQFDGV